MQLNTSDPTVAHFKPEEWPGRWQDAEPACKGDPTTLKQGAISALCEKDLDQKIKITRITARKWFNGSLGIGADISLVPPDRPGRPEKPALVSPGNTKKRSLHTERGRFALLHAIAHIELNAIDLAWDIVARFAGPHNKAGRRMPRSFYDGSETLVVQYDDSQIGRVLDGNSCKRAKSHKHFTITGDHQNAPGRLSLGQSKPD